MIIFGWGRQTIKNIGIVFKYLCSNCHNEEYWILTRIMTWFTLFFIPIIPYETKYRLICPVCNYGLTLEHKQIQELRPIAETNQLLINGKITQEEHQILMQKLPSGSPDTIQTKKVETKALSEGETKVSYCSNCETALTKELKFCGNCGTPVPSK